MDADRASAEHESWKSRAWPGLRNILASWKIPFRGGLQVIPRRLCMWTILVIRVVISIFFIAFQTLGIHIVSAVVGVILLVMNFFFMLWCFAIIDRAEGFRNVLCLRVVSLELRQVVQGGRKEGSHADHVRTGRAGPISTCSSPSVPCFTSW